MGLNAGWPSNCSTMDLLKMLKKKITNGLNGLVRGNKILKRKKKKRNGEKPSDGVQNGGCRGHYPRDLNDVPAKHCLCVILVKKKSKRQYQRQGSLKPFWVVTFTWCS
jgi:hypothetical protein